MSAPMWTEVQHAASGEKKKEKYARAKMQRKYLDLFAGLWFARLVIMS